MTNMKSSKTSKKEGGREGGNRNCVIKTEKKSEVRNEKGSCDIRKGKREDGDKGNKRRRRGGRMYE